MSALTAISEDTGLIRQPALSSTGQEVVSATLAPVQRPQTHPSSDLGNVLARLGPDKYSYFDFDQFSFHSSSANYFKGSSQVIVKGRLRANFSFWQSIGASKFILGTLSFGYQIPFLREPTSVFLSNNRSALDNSDFVESAILELLTVGSIVSCTSPPGVVSALSVSVQSSGKKRLILDLRHVNFFVSKSKIKFEDAQSMLNFSLVSLLLICGLILSILSLVTIMLRFIPHIKDFSVFRGFSKGFENILSLSFCSLVLLQALTFSPKSYAPSLSNDLVRPSAL